jgi:hypothetical protein
MTNTIFARLGKRLRHFRVRLRAYLRRLLFPLYLFPLKLATYSLYYALRALGRFVLEMLRIVRDMIIFPFRSLRNFLTAIFFIFLLKLLNPIYHKFDFIIL